MASLGELLGAMEEQMFVGRTHELSVFRRWLTARVPKILNVTGPGGVGKSALLRAFRRLADAEGRRVLLLDGREFRAVPDGLHGALRECLSLPPFESPADAHRAIVERLNELRPLLLLDTFEELVDLTSYLRDEFLPRLDAQVRVVIAGREPLGAAWRHQDVWQRIVQPLRLHGFSDLEARSYLERRGLHDPAAVESLMRGTGGYPLALALAADVASREAQPHLSTSPEWRLTVRGIVRRLLDHVRDVRLRELIEAAAVVREFDEGSLAAIAGGGHIDAFEDLWHLSLVQPVEHGLTLHDDVRRIIEDDLRWRNPERYRELRSRALASYQARMATAAMQERERLLAAQFFLWEDTLVRDLLFADDTPGRVWIEPARPQDLTEVTRLWGAWLDDVLPGQLRPTAEHERAPAFLQGLLAYEGTRVRLARDRNGRTLGFNTLLPVCRASMPIIDQHPRLRTTLRAYADEEQLARLPPTADEAGVFFLVHVVYGAERSDAVRAALARDLLAQLVRGGVYLAVSTIPAYQQLLERLGWQPLPQAGRAARSPRVTTRAYVLDLSHTSVEVWLEAALGSAAPVVAPGDEPEDRPQSPAAAQTESGQRPLTRRERQIATLIAHGLQNREIAAELSLSARTVDAHTEHIRHKLGVRSRAEIAGWAVATSRPRRT
jgi:DNA-binding CsgD family transcriptional regulator